ncbi:MAG: MBL fold metallo-hydrolase [Candidatus Promineifilaceae bacterium]|jgi:L-ascorbate metabolism protein UlaG (beta-lactamase superfamily)
MELTWYGLSCFRLSERKHASIVTDPYGRTIGLPELKLRADVVTVSHNAKGHSYLPAVSGSRHVLDGPGEYEIGSVFITGIASYSKDGNGRNVIYVFDMDGISVAHLGDIQQVPEQKEIEALGQVNILLTPVGGGNSLNAAQAAELVSLFEPNIVVPMHYKIPGLKLDLDDVDRFLKEMGVTEPREEATLKLTTSGLPEETETVVLKPKV